MVQNLKVKVKQQKTTERKNKSKKSAKLIKKVHVKSLRKKNKQVTIDKIETMTKKLCVSANNSLKFLDNANAKKK
ncbi:conserved protein, unknown function [Hepatocystis sp. ex Piliocolobus tephrosceles]|nr:conserved protein, unknown function [Hepatocystis sp. ex Piliocolobus tephrosceles]